MNDIIRLRSVEYGETRNHLKFKGYIPRLDPNLLYTFDFIGIDIWVSTYLDKEAKTQLVKCLRKDFGYAPYDLNVVKRKFGNGKDYLIDLF